MIQEIKRCMFENWHGHFMIENMLLSNIGWAKNLCCQLHVEQRFIFKGPQWIDALLYIGLLFFLDFSETYIIAKGIYTNILVIENIVFIY